MSQKPHLPKGMRDFFGATLQKRQYIIQTIQHFFERYGFEPLETPSVENTSTLMGKYGEEGEKLIFRILNNGDVFKDVADVANTKQVLAHISDRALRYDLTIPFARFVVMNHHALPMPFKRYQIQAVWRGDRPQRGRYREFYQCDADLVGSDSLLHEVEFIQLYQQVFDTLKIPQVSVKINSRKILTALIEKLGITEQSNALFIAIDKIDKMGIPAVLQELQTSFDKQVLVHLEAFFAMNHLEDNDKKIAALGDFFSNSLMAKKGMEELTYVLKNLQYQSGTKVAIDLSLARGLNYYTGLIFEVKTTAVAMGSIGGGGRYDNLTESMGLANLSGVGISFGIDRIYDVMEELQIFPTSLRSSQHFLFFNMGDEELKQCLALSLQLRQQGCICEIYHQKDKLDKQFKYAEKKGITFVIIIGATELQSQQMKIKNIQTGVETSCSFKDIATIVSLAK